MKQIKNKSLKNSFTSNSSTSFLPSSSSSFSTSTSFPSSSHSSSHSSSSSTTTTKTTIKIEKKSSEEQQINFFLIFHQLINQFLLLQNEIQEKTGNFSIQIKEIEKYCQLIFQKYEEMLENNSKLKYEINDLQGIDLSINNSNLALSLFFYLSISINQSFSLLLHFYFLLIDN